MSFDFFFLIFTVSSVSFGVDICAFINEGVSIGPGVNSEPGVLRILFPSVVFIVISGFTFLFMIDISGTGISGARSSELLMPPLVAVLMALWSALLPCSFTDITENEFSKE